MSAGVVTCPQQNQIAHAASPPTLAKNARMGHPQLESCTQRPLKAGHSAASLPALAKNARTGHPQFRNGKEKSQRPGHPPTRTHLEAAQPLAAKRADRGGQTGTALESATGGAARPRVGTRASQPGHAGGGAQTRHLSVGRRQKRAELSAAGAVARGRSGKGRGAKNQNRLRRKNLRTTGDRPAVPRQFGDWAKEFRLRMPLTVCIEAGWQTLTHTSRTGLTLGSRKWMSGQAAALAARNDRGRFANLIAVSPLRDTTLASVRRPPSPLDFYLSWMSPGFRRGC